MQQYNRRSTQRDPLMGGRSSNDDVTRAFREIERFAEVLRPEDVEEPILSPSVTAAVYEWLTEIDSVEELAAKKVPLRRMALLYGPPGTGKTTLAHHIAARKGLPLVAVESEKIVDKWLGSTGQNLGQLFDLLRDIEHACVVLFDEFDALATKRTEDRGGGAQNERNQALTVMLRRIEAFRGIGLAATNTKLAIDAAMWRRFGLMISVDLPEGEERFAIIRKYAMPYDLEDEDIDRIVKITTGCSPSLLRLLMEGMKRALILAPKLKRDVSCPLNVFSQLRMSVAPPPELEQPPLWSDSYSIEELRGMSWPPKLMEG